MMDLSAVRQIQARIAEIEGEFSLQNQQLPGMDFAAKLQQEINKNVTSAADKAHAAQGVQAVQETSAAHKSAGTAQGNIANPELTRLIHAAAQKYVNPYNMQGNVEGGTKYLREMLDTFGGDVKKAVAAYNAGPNAVKAYGGVPPYAETQNYVTSVLDIYR